ncbi:MAG TPA: lytic transglycosylase domain-containing protein [Polyangiaceae bacterium]|nr:lytic transglycosylase domain-containing protein [Polyangiaceae bacterium]
MTLVRLAATRGALALAAFAGLAGSPGSSFAGDIYQSEENGVISFTNTHKKGKLYARVPSPPSRSAASDTVATGSSRYDEYIRAAAGLYQLPEAFVRAVIRVESGFDPRAISRTNARGLMQLMPETAERMMVTDVFDPRQNIYGGVRYLRVLANLFNGDIELTLAGYNAGENAVIHYGGIPPYEETRAYVVKVMEYYRYYRENTATAAAR